MHMSRKGHSPIRSGAIPVILLVLICAFSIVIFLYGRFERYSLDMLETSNISLMGQSRIAINYLNDVVYGGGSQIFSDLYVEAAMKTSDPSPALLVHASRVLDKLGNYGIPIHSVYAYNSKADLFCTSCDVPWGNGDEFFDQGIIPILNDIKSGKLENGPIYRYIPKPYSPGLEAVYTYIIPRSSSSSKLAGALIVNVSASWFDDMLSRLFPDMTILLINENDRVIADSMGHDTQLKERTEEIMRMRTAGSGRFVVRSDEGDDIFFYSAISGTGWCFVRYARWDDIFGTLDAVKTFTYLGIVLISVFVAAAGLANTIRLFRPLKKIETELNTSNVSSHPLPVVDYVDMLIVSSTQAKTVEKNYMRHLRTEYFRQLLSRTGSSMQTVESEFGIYGVSFDHEKPFVMIEIATASEEKAAELSEIFHLSQRVALRNGRTVLFVQEENLNQKQLEEKLAELGLQASISHPLPWNGNIREAFDAVEEALSYHFFSTFQKTIYSVDILESRLSVLPESMNLEPQILQSLAAAREDKAWETYSTYIESLSACRFSSIIFLIKRLYMAAVGHPDKVDETVMAKLDDAIAKCDRATIDEVFRTVFKERIERVLKSRESRIGNLVKDVDAMIEKEHTDKNLSIQGIATKLGLSPVYLGKLYREEKGHSVSDSINSCRIKHAKDLLRTTDMTVREVSDAAGFPNSKYFYTLFRNATLQSPAEWRARK